MKIKKTESLNKIIIGVVLALLVGGSSPWWWKKYIDSPSKKTAEIIKEQKIYKKGNKTFKIEGVYIPPSSNNMSDSYIFKNIDLDSGNLTNSLNADLKTTINVNKLLISMNLKEGALVGNSETSYLKCKSLLKNNNGKKLEINNKKAQTPYYCTETNNGRISQFTFTSINKYKTPVKNIYSIIVNLKYTTWEL